MKRRPHVAILAVLSTCLLSEPISGNDESFGLYAGVTQYLNNIDLSSVSVEEDEKDVVSTPEPGTEAYALSWSNEDYEQLAHLIYAEAGSQGDKCMIYVGSVLLNRVASSRYPDTIEECIHQYKQYGVADYYMSLEPSEDAYLDAEYLLTNGPQLPEYVLYQHYKVPVDDTTIYTTENGEVFSY